MSRGRPTDARIRRLTADSPRRFPRSNEKSPTACRDYITIDATVSVITFVGQLEKQGSTADWSTWLKTRGSWVRIPPAQLSYCSAVAQRIEHRKSLINTSSVLLIHARLPVWSTWQETDEQVLRVQTPPGPLRLEAMDRSSAQPSSSVLRVLIRLPGAEYIHHQPMPREAGVSQYPCGTAPLPTPRRVFFQWRSPWPTRRCFRA